LKHIKVLLILLLIHTTLIFADNKSIVIQSANTVIDVLEERTFVRHLTPYIADIARNGHLLPEETKDRLKSLGFNFSSDMVTMQQSTYYDYSYDTPHFRIHYDLAGNNAVDNTDSDGDNIPDYIETVGREFENVYDHEINELGYTKPPSDGIAGGSSAYDIYIRNTNAYGWTNWIYPAVGNNENSSENEINAYSSYITIRNNYIGFPNTELENIQVTTGHEFFHAIQLGYDGDENYWLMEATAVWMEEETHDNVNDCYQYMIPWFEEPHLSLNPPNSTFTIRWYGAYIFFKYIDEHLGGKDIIKKTWEQSRIHDSTKRDYSIQSIDEALKSRNHTFKKALNNMALANIIFSDEDAAGQYAYEEAIGYHNYRELSFNDTIAIELGIHDSLNFINGIPANIESNNLQLYGSQYVKINAIDPVKLSINTQNLKLHAVVKSNSGNYEVQSGPVLNIDPDLNNEWIYAVVVADDSTSQNYDYTLSFTDGIKNTITDFTILSQFPNPFNSTTNIKLKIITPQNIDINVYDILGRKIATIFSGNLTNGIYEYSWNGTNTNNEMVSSGVYYITAMSDSRQEWKKITLVK